MVKQSANNSTAQLKTFREGAYLALSINLYLSNSRSHLNIVQINSTTTNSYTNKFNLKRYSHSNTTFVHAKLTVTK